MLVWWLVLWGIAGWYFLAALLLWYESLLIRRVGEKQYAWWDTFLFWFLSPVTLPLALAFCLWTDRPTHVVDIKRIEREDDVKFRITSTTVE